MRSVETGLTINESDWREWVGSQRVTRGRSALTAPNDQLAAVAERHELPLLDLLPSLTRESGGDPRRFYFQTDQHWNRDAHALAARELEQFLVERGLVPAPR